MGVTRSSAALALVLSVAASVLPTTAHAQEDGFARQLEACRAAVARRQWGTVRKEYAQLFDEFEGDARVVAEREAIERDLQQALFNRKRKAPTGEQLFGPAVQKFSASTGRIDLVFEQGTDDPFWQSTEGQMKLLPLRWTDDVSITVPARGHKDVDKKVPWSQRESAQVRLRALLCFNLEKRGGYLAITAHGIGGGDYNRDQKNPAEVIPSKFRLFRFGGLDPDAGLELLGCDDWDPKSNWSSGYCRWARITRKGDLIKLESEKCSDSRTKDLTFRGGYVALSAQWGRSAPPTVRVEGALDKQFVKTEIAKYEAKAFREWKEASYRAEDALPTWLVGATLTTTKASIALPADTPEAMRPAIREFLRFMLSDERTTDEPIPEVDGLPPATAALVGGARALMRGELAQSELLFTALMKVDPEFRAAHLWRALARYYRREIDAANADLDVAREHLADDPNFHELVAKLHLIQGDLEAARAALGSAREAGVWTERLRELSVGVDTAVRGPQWRNRHRKKTRQFDVFSDHSAEMCQRVGKILSDGVLRYARTFRPLPENRRPARVYVFSSKTDYEAFATKLGASLTHSAGAYLPRLGVLVIWMPIDRRDFEATVRHEGFHQYVHNFVEDLPLWFNEGWAEFFGNIPEESKAFSHRTDVQGLVARIERKDVKFGSVRDLMLMSRSDFMRSASTNYLHAWALLSYLQSKEAPAYSGKTDEYFAVLLAGKSPQEAYDEVFAPVETELQGRFEHFLSLKKTGARPPR